MSDRVGILLAGGNGTRLHPITKAINKQLLPIYDKPMIYYPLSILLILKIRKIIIIHRPKDYQSYYDLLGNGDQFGCEFIYVKQDMPGGIAESLLLSASHIKGKKVTLVLGDNLFIANELMENLINAQLRTIGCTLFATKVSNPNSYGVIKYKDEKPIEICEKPAEHVSDYIVTGLYCYDHTVLDRAHKLVPSERGELEITDLNNSFLSDGSVNIEYFGRGVAWFDTGDVNQILSASQMIKSMQDHSGYLICSPHEIAFKNDFIDLYTLSRYVQSLGSSNYKYLLENIT